MVIVKANYANRVIMITNMKDNLVTENMNAEYQKRSYDDLS